MFAINRALPALFLSCLTLVSAQTASTVQNDWVFPALPDESTTLTNGNQYTLRWTSDLHAWFAQYASAAVVTNVDLYFVASGDSNDAGYLVKAGINVNTTYSLTWTINVSNTDAQIYEDWSFKFVPAGRNGLSQQQVASPQIILNPSPVASSSSSSSSVSTSTTTTSASKSASTTPTTTTSATAATTTSATATSSGSSSGASSSATAVPINNGLSTGAKAGIAIGAIGAAALLGILAFFLLRNNRRNKEHLPISQSSPPPTNPTYPVEPKESYNMQRMGGYYKDNPASSPPVLSTQEMSGTTPQYAELDGGQYARPNIAEMGAGGYRR